MKHIVMSCQLEQAVNAELLLNMTRSTDTTTTVTDYRPMSSSYPKICLISIPE